ncbi:Thiol:disulfide interchange protein DsbC [hydrothermal vent metagenome]|uniref:Thiol:disulfide interchange protein DsbC n=1 Tax=hydrothermal vent metagenome TaxID=652676 RepID=A0A3B1A5K7_9ZZZZ
MKLLKVMMLGVVLGFPMGFSTVVSADNKDDEIKIITAQVLKELKSAPGYIKESPIPGLYEVAVGSQIFYFYKDGRYVISGDLFDMQKGLNLTQAARYEAQMVALRTPKPENVEALNKMGEAKMIVFAPKGKVKHTISVFTDIDCGYCRKLHKEMSKYNALGIKIRYLAYPRAGVGSGSYKKAVSVWCADDRKKALTLAKNGAEIEEKTCDNPVQEQMALGEKFGVTGTPALILENGQLYPGYMPADKLIILLDSVKSDSK